MSVIALLQTPGPLSRFDCAKPRREVSLGAVNNIAHLTPDESPFGSGRLTPRGFTARKPNRSRGSEQC